MNETRLGWEIIYAVAAMGIVAALIGYRIERRLDKLNEKIDALLEKIETVVD